MSLVAALILAAAARVETVGLATVDSRLAVSVDWSGTLGRVSVERQGDVARISLEGAQLGARFSGAKRFEWKGASLPADFPVSRPALDGIRIEDESATVTLYVRLQRASALEVRRHGQRLVLVLPRADVPPEGTRMATAPEPPAVPAPPLPPPPRATAVPVLIAAPAAALPPPPPPVRAAETGRERRAEKPAAPPTLLASLDLERFKALFPVASVAPEPESEPGPELPPAPVDAEGPPESLRVASADSASLYPRLFPSSPSSGTIAAAEPTPATGGLGGDGEEGLRLGSLRLRPALSASYVAAEVTVLSPQPARDAFFQVQPELTVVAPVSEGRLSVGYQPTLRTFGSYPVVQRDTHRIDAALDVPVGPRLSVRATDHFVTGVLETTEVDPGREYFFDLGRFDRHAVGFGARVELEPRLSLELGAGLNRVRFDEPGGFFDYDSRLLSAGVGFEFTPRLRALASYSHDWVPTPADRPQAEASAHAAQLTLNGELLPLLRGQLAVGYRDQTSPNAPEGGRSFRGLTLSGGLTRDLGRSSSVGLSLNRSTPLSAFESNAFYVSSSVQAMLAAALPASFSFDGGASYHWNDYRTPALDLGQPREDRIFGWYLGLRRPVNRWARLSAFYRRDRRSSNLDNFDSVVQGLVLRLDVTLNPGQWR